jgi:Na+/H+-dicarboxylate symporter
MGSTRQILFGLVAGIATGLFLGEYAAGLGILAEAYVKLLQMTVLPYVVVSIVSGLGALTLAQAKILGLRTGTVLLLLWALGLAIVFVFPLMFPSIETASFFSTTLLEPPRAFNLVDLYIPSNPFYSLANAIVPAVVLFSIMMGVALIGTPGKEKVLDVLEVLRRTVARVTGLVVRLTPIGLFAVAATAVGTLSVEQWARLEVYLLAYGAMALVGGLWLVPGLIAVLTPVPYRRVFAVTRDAMVTAFVTAELFVVLPILSEGAKALVREYGLGERAADAPDVIVPASFNFPHVGKVMTLSFVLFAGWYSGSPVAPALWPQLASAGILTLFGNVNAAVPFLLDLFRIPADTYQLFVATSVINARFGTLLAAMHTVAMALIGTWAMAGALRLERRRLIGYAITSVLLVGGAVAGVRGLVWWLAPPAFEGRRIVYGMELLRHGTGDAVRYDAPPAPPATVAGEAALDRIRRLGVLRVGYVDDNLPFTYLNDKGTLVGFDAELAHALAQELGVRLAFVRVTRATFAAAVRDGTCDLVMSGIAVSTDRAADTVFSKPYLDETLAFIVPDHARGSFASWAAIERTPHLRVGVSDQPYFVAQAKARMPRAEIVPFATAEALIAAVGTRVDASVLTAERGSAWTLVHPRLAVVVPFPDPVKVALAYPMAHDVTLARFVDVWVDLKRKDGTVQALYDYWFLGKHATPARPRWSVLRNVLHWVE